MALGVNSERGWSSVAHVMGRASTFCGASRALGSGHETRDEVTYTGNKIGLCAVIAKLNVLVYMLHLRPLLAKSCYCHTEIGSEAAALVLINWRTTRNLDTEGGGGDYHEQGLDSGFEVR